jgi:hypothetical protein
MIKLENTSNVYFTQYIVNTIYNIIQRKNVHIIDPKGLV